MRQVPIKANQIRGKTYAGRQCGEAVEGYGLAVRFDPSSSRKEASLGQAYAQAGELTLAEQHLEKAIQLDPLNLSAATTLIGIYDKTGESLKLDELSKRLAALMQDKVQPRR